MTDDQAPRRLDATVTGRVQGVGFRYFVLREAMDLGLVPTLTSVVYERQRFREYREPCLWLSHGPIGLGEECQKIRPHSLCSCGLPGRQALGDLLDPLSGLSLLR